MKARQYRNRQGVHFRRCPECEGGGSVTVRHASGDPQLEVDELCPNKHCIGGWMRMFPTDPLEKMRNHRQFELLGRTRKMAGPLYWDARAEAMKPVRRLPRYVPEGYHAYLRRVDPVAAEVFAPVFRAMGMAA